MKLSMILLFALMAVSPFASATLTAQNICRASMHAAGGPLNCSQLSGEAQEACVGIKKGTLSRPNCEGLEGLAKSMCDGTKAVKFKYRECVESADCKDLKGHAKSVCLGTYYAQACDDSLSCDRLKGFSQTVCWGILHASSANYSCEDLSF